MIARPLAPARLGPSTDSGSGRQPSTEGRLAVLARCSLFAGLAIALSTLGLVVAAYDPLPYWDQWDNLVSASDVTWSWLGRQHNEHRIVLDRLLVLADHDLCGETYRLAYAILAILPLASTALVMRICRNPGRGLPPPWSLGLALGFLFSAMQHENFTWAFQVSFLALCCLALATLALHVLGPPSLWCLGAVVALEAAALGTLSSGVLLLPLTVLTAVALRRPWWHCAVLGVAGATLLALYLHGYRTPSGHADPIDSLAHLDRVALFAAVALGHPFGTLVASRGTVAAFVMGVVGFAWFATRAWRLARERRRRDPAQLVLIGTAAFVVGTVMLMALGRWRFGVGQALMPRYATPTLLFWLVMLLQEAAPDDQRPGRAGLGVAALGVAALGLLLVNQPRFIEAGLRNLPNRRSATLAVLAGVGDEDILSRTYPVADTVLSYGPLMKAASTSVFAAPWARWLDQPFRLALGSTVPPCRGWFGRPVEVGSSNHRGWRVGGHLPRGEWPKASDRLVIVDAEGVVRGYGFAGLSDRVALLGANSTGRDAWLGEVEDVDPVTLRAYLLRSDDLPACRLDADGPAADVALHAIRPER